MKIVALAGGVGGAKMADGLAQILSPDNLTIIVNTGDDFEHLGLYISPDLDTICYTLAGLANPEVGWGRAGETYQMMEGIQQLGGPVWFRIGDRDLATHIERTRRLQQGQTLSRITREFCQAWGLKLSILPMSDDPVRTMVDTCDCGVLPFQEYFVRRHFEPKVKGFRFAGVETASPAPGVIEAIQKTDAVLICPSNPWVSIDPILALTGIRSALATKPVFAISPIIAGQTVKGPAAKMYLEMGIQPSAIAVFNHYKMILSGFVLDKTDADQFKEIEIPTLITNILMKSPYDRRCLAQDVLNLIQS
jgi:LPPG:FO 2-phospho-L-lactate transferase